MEVFKSRKNRVRLTDGGEVVKIFSDPESRKREAEILKRLNGFKSPSLITEDADSVTMEYVAGDLLIDRYLSADSAAARALASELMKTVTGLSKLMPDKIPSDENFRNYIVTDCGITRVDFEETAVGSMENWLAKILAFSSLYAVPDNIKFEFARELLEKITYNKKILTSEFKKELEFLAKRWDTVFPDSVYLKTSELINFKNCNK